MTAAFVGFHRTSLYHPTYPSPEGEGFTDPLSGTLNKQRNAEHGRRALAPIGDSGAGDTAATAASPRRAMAPLLEQIMADYAATGLPPAFLPFDHKDANR
jgi:hypothetical protein